MRHLGANLYSRYRSRALVRKFKGLCLQNQQSKFNNIWRDLNETTRQMMQQQQQREDMLQSQMVGGQVVVNRSRSMFTEFIDYIFLQVPPLRVRPCHKIKGVDYRFHD